MKYNLHRLPALLLFVLIPAFISADGDFEQLLERRLEENIQYRQARLDRSRAELSLNQLKNFALPYLTLEGGRTGIVYTEGELQPVELQGSLRWTNVLGTDISISSPIKFDQEEIINSVNVNLSRQLLPENDVRELRARAALLRAIENELDAEHAVLRNLLNEVFIGYLETERFRLARENLMLLEQELAAAVSADSRRTLQQRILRARRQLLQAEQAMLDMDPYIRSRTAVLREQALNAAQERILPLPELSGIHTQRPDGSLALSAQEYSLAAAQLEGRRALLAYLPNPRIAFDWQYRLPEQQTQWSLSLQFSLDILDRGERAMEAMRRKEQPEIERLRLLEAQRRHQDEFRRALTQHELLVYDRSLQEFSLEDALEAETRAERLFGAGFINEETYRLAVLDRKTAELAMQELEQNTVLRKLELQVLYSKTGLHNE